MGSWQCSSGKDGISQPTKAIRSRYGSLGKRHGSTNGNRDQN